MSQKELGCLIGKSQKAVSKYEKNEREPDHITLEKIAKALNIDYLYLLKGEKSILTNNELEILCNLDDISRIIKQKNLLIDGKTPTKEELSIFIDLIKTFLKAIKNHDNEE